MPSDKRARKRAGRQAKLAEQARQRKRRAAIRRTVVMVVVAAVVVGAIALSRSGSKTKPKAALRATTTTAARPTTTTAASGDTQAAANAAAVAAGCPESPSTKLSKPTWTKAPALSIDPSKTYTATVTTDLGPFTVSLDAKQAPNTVNSFVFLADQHFFDCVTFHRVIPGFMDQTGDPTGTGTGGPGYQFADENLPSSSAAYTTGVVAMANAGANTNGSQFFIMAANYPIGTNYSIFGQVTSGQAIVDKINADGTAGSGVPPRIIHRMLKVTIAVS